MLCVWNVWLSQSQPRGEASSRVSTLRGATVIVGSTRQQITGKQSPESANGQPGSVTSHPPAVPVQSSRQSDRPPPFSPICTGTPDGRRVSTNVTDGQSDADLTDVKTFNSPSFLLSTVNATVDSTITAPYSMGFLVNFFRLFDASTLNMLPYPILESLAPNITVTIHSVQTAMLDSGAQIIVLPSYIAADFDPPILLPSVTREIRIFGNHQVTWSSFPKASVVWYPYPQPVLLHRRFHSSDW